MFLENGRLSIPEMRLLDCVLCLEEICGHEFAVKLSGQLCIFLQIVLAVYEQLASKQKDLFNQDRWNICEISFSII